MTATVNGESNPDETGETAQQWVNIICDVARLGRFWPLLAVAGRLWPRFFVHAGDDDEQRRLHIRQSRADAFTGLSAETLEFRRASRTLRRPGRSRSPARNLTGKLTMLAKPLMNGLPQPPPTEMVKKRISSGQVWRAPTHEAQCDNSMSGVGNGGTVGVVPSWPLLAVAGRIWPRFFVCAGGNHEWTSMDTNGETMRCVASGFTAEARSCSVRVAPRLCNRACSRFPGKLTISAPFLHRFSFLDRSIPHVALGTGNVIGSLQVPVHS